MLAITNFIKGRLDHSENQTQRKFVITGGPGVGKSSIINYLAKEGHTVVQEAATDIIKEELAKGTQEPWNQDWFEDRVIECHNSRYAEAVASQAQHIFFDRGHIDPVVYILRRGLELPQNIKEEVQRSIDQALYDKTVFFIDNLGFVEQEDFRVETNDVSISIEKDIKRSYKTLGYKIIKIPAFKSEPREIAIQKRAEMILQHCGIVL